MKKQILLLTLLLSVAANAFAIEAEINGLWYELVTKADYKGASVIKYKNNVKYSGDIVIPETVEYEGANYNVTSIAGGNIFQGAFSGCNGLTSVTIPNSVTSIGDGAFYDCNGLTSVHITDIASWCNIVFGDNPLYYAHHLCLGEEEITDLVIPDTVTNIESAFYGCSGLNSVTIPNSVRSIGNSAFAGCSGLTSVTIPNTVTSIGNYAFSGCSGLSSVTIPNTVTSIGNYAFSGCSGLSSITIGNSVTNIGVGAFSGCNDLAFAMIPNSVTAIGSSAFYGCSGLASVTISNSVTSIGELTFSGCSALTTVTIPNSVTSIGDYAFQYCSSLTSVTIPNSVTNIGSYAFQRCSGLTSVTIGNSVTSIKDRVFQYCSSLISITIGSGVKTIGLEAFAKCPELSDVYCYAENVPSTMSDAFLKSYIDYATLHVPTASIDAYKAVKPWKSFKNIVELDGIIPESQKCATPTITYINGNFVFGCETEGVEYEYEINNVVVKKGQGSKVKLDNEYMISVYATKAGYDNSDVATLEFTLGPGGEVCDVNKDGTVDVADIATIISRMAGKK